ncbi:MAG: TonB family protein [Sphingomonadaceae bacterium]|nr:TonB family protein [Sphingomonadaceae bacterium]
MAYVDDHARSKLPSLTAVAIVHVAIGYALISGLAATVIHRVDPPLLTYPVAADPPPPPPHPQPLPKTPRAPTQTVPPILPPITIDLSRLSPIDTGPLTDSTSADPGPRTEVWTVPPTSLAAAARPRGDKTGWITSEDYPSAALRQGDEGTVTIRARIGTDGHVSDCAIAVSSGHASLDEATCRLYARRARFTPARDAGGAATESTTTDRIAWQIPR